MSLANAIRDDDGDGRQISDYLNTLLGACEHPRVLLSSEALGALATVPRNNDNLARFADILSVRTRKVTVFFMVRHLTDHMWSQYGELVRRRGRTFSFEDFAMRDQSSFKAIADGYSHIFGRENVIVKRYEDGGKDSTGFAADALKLPETPALPYRINRSLTAYEIEVARQLYSKTDDFEKARDFLLVYGRTTETPDGFDRVHIESRVLDRIKEKHSAYVQEFTETYLDSDHPLLLASDRIHPQENSLEWGPRDDLLVDMLAKAL